MAELQQDNQETAIPASTPGAVITPASATANTTSPVPVNGQTEAATTPQSPLPVPPTPPENTTPPEPETSLFKSESPKADEATPGITWTSSEFHMHEKSAGWYLMLAIATIGLAAILYLLTGSIVTPVVVVICGIILGVYATRKPAPLDYAMDHQGISIGTKQYLYDDFQLFVVTPSSPSPEVMLIPVKRFMPSVSIRYVPELEDKILSMLSDHLPLEERRLDLIDSLMQRIHF